MTSEVIIAAAALAAGPLTMVAFKLLPQKSKNGKEPDAANHDHNAKYMPRELCTAKHERTELMLTTMGSDIKDIKEHFEKLDNYVRAAIRHETHL